MLGMRPPLHTPPSTAPVTARPLLGTARPRAAPPSGTLGPATPWSTAASRLPSLTRAAMATAAPHFDEAAAAAAVRAAAAFPSPSRPLPRLIVDAVDPAADVVLLGEASHGTQEFYAARAEATLALVRERGFTAVCIEGDFPDVFRANRWVRGVPQRGDESAEDALRDFQRFPTWMWRNTAVVAFLRALRAHNDALPPARRVGIYGLDVYSMHASAARVIEFLEAADPPAAARARYRYSCFDNYGDDAQAYAAAVALGGAPSCAPAALAMLRDVLHKAGEYARFEAAGAGGGDGALLGEELAFAARCNAAVVAGAEAYYRNMFFSEESTWNIRDRHFLTTLGLVADHLGGRAKRVGAPLPPRLVVWAHNSHVGDARATDMGRRRGEVNVGQLAREAFGRGRVAIVGFTTHAGAVAAADDWDAPMRVKRVRPSLPGSYEAALHAAAEASAAAGGPRDFVVDLAHGGRGLAAALAGPALQRAIGVVYRPGTERASHYYRVHGLAEQFDAVAHVDATSPVAPLDAASVTAEREVDAPETYPFAL